MYLYFFNLKIVANHAGSVQFRVCQVTDLNKDPTMDCFEQNILKFENGQEKFPLKKAVKTDEKVYNKNYEYVRSERWHNFKVKLPDNLECAHCLFQVN